ncbi:MAG: DUF5011 domain-containing protein [Streptococcaceae bacterium]|nr:DUF5011 domain-containing protein [Streptococcaceae bacterium]
MHDVTITTGDSFDPLSGVSATDYEDGNLTDKIQVTGTVDTNKAGSYKLIYSVEDKEGQKVSKERIVTVQDEAAPSFTGVGDVTLTVGEQFNPLTGVKAIDVNGNDVTAAIEVTSNVDTTKVGSYEVTYSVVSVSGKAVATKTRQVSVKEFTGNEWNADTIYLGGDTVIYNGVEYTAKWWTKGDVPGESDVWSEVSYHSTTAQEYSASRSYQVGDTVIYNGVEYTAKWWTQGDIPGISDIWEAVN